jgi:hypothetical protein
MNVKEKSICFYQMFNPATGRHAREDCGNCQACEANSENEKCKCYKRMTVRVIEENHLKFVPISVEIEN